MATKIGMPNLGHTMEAGTVVQWLKQEGETVARGEPLAEVESDKVVFTIEAPASGVLLRVIVPANATVKVGHVLGYVGEPGEPVPEVDAAPQPLPVASPGIPAPPLPAAAPRPSGPGERPRISPLARRLAQEHGLDPEQLPGSGPRGSVTQEDVLAAVAAHAQPPAVRTPAAPAVAERRPLRAMRRTIAQRMTQSWQQAPQVTQMLEVNMSAAEHYRQGRDLSVNDLILAAAARALVEFPQLNAALVDDSIEVYADVNIGLAVALDDGLVTPVVRGADRLSLAELNRQRRGLVDKATAGRLELGDMADGTFTITNLGSEGIRFFTPILNPPQAAILGMGQMARSAAVVDGRLEVRPLMGLSLTFDHRVVDGLPAARFLARIKSLLEDPAGLAAHAPQLGE